jgi:ABC-2 type transport system ATP-binding protein
MAGRASLRTVNGMIRARNLTKRYGRTLAVDQLSFEVQPGHVTGFLGPNGAGKSTTMRMILGLDAPTSGEVTVKGVAYRQLPAPLREVGALLDARAFQGGRRARDHLRWLAESNRVPLRRVDEVIGIVGLGDVAAKRAGGFSLGMAQRLGIAAALLGDPEVLLFDEPVNGLDPEGIVWIRNLLKSLAAEGRTVFVSSHLMAEMALTADHLLVVGRGRLIAQTTVDEFILRSSAAHVRVRTPRPGELAGLLSAHGAVVNTAADGALEITGIGRDEVGDLALRSGLAVHELVLQEPSLETAYMELTHDAVDYRALEPAH